MLGLQALEAALELEKKVNQALIHLHKLADTHNDPQVCWCVTDQNSGVACGFVHD